MMPAVRLFDFSGCRSGFEPDTPLTEIAQFGLTVGSTGTGQVTGSRTVVKNRDGLCVVSVSAGARKPVA